MKKARPTPKKAAAKKSVTKKVATKKAVAWKPASEPVGASGKSAMSKKALRAETVAAIGTGSSPAADLSDANGSKQPDVSKAVSHVIASLKKTASRPTKQWKLVSTIKSLLGPSADEHTVHSVLSHMLASGTVVISGSGRVGYGV